jgi:hypothetical protein
MLATGLALSPRRTIVAAISSSPAWRNVLVTTALVFAAVIGLVPAVSADTDLKPPTGYRQWFHVNTQIVDKTSPLFDALGGMHVITINAIGLPALKKGTPFPDKTVFVDDLHDFTVTDGVTNEGGRKAIVLMVKDAKKYAATGGWGWQAWAGGDPKKPLVTDAAKQCFSCHVPQKAHDYVYSTYIP